MIETLLHFESECGMLIEWPDRPVSIADQVRQAIESGLLVSTTPFYKTLTGPETIWSEILILTDSGRVKCGLRPMNWKLPEVRQKSLFGD